MFTSGFFLRLLIAAFGAIILILIIPAFLRLIGFPVSGDLLMIIKLVIAAIAVYYVFSGSTHPTLP